MNLEALCSELKNYFVVEKQLGQIVIEDGALQGSDGYLKEGQYYRIVGSVFNDGVYMYGNEILTDESFNGGVWAMAVPKEVIELLTDINRWVVENQKAIDSPFQSESFGGYSYTLKGSNQNEDSSVSWKRQFAKELKRWRKLNAY